MINIIGREGRQKLAIFKVIFYLLIFCFYFIKQPNYKLYYVSLMIISEIQSKSAYSGGLDLEFLEYTEYAITAI